MTRRWSTLAGRILANLVLLTGAALMLLPFAWMILTSVKPPNEIFLTEFRLLPETWWVWQNYSKVFTDVPMLRFLANGVLVCAAIVAIQLCVAVPAAYALAKIRFRGREALFGLILVSLLIPMQVPSIPLYLVFARTGLTDSYAGLILPFAISSFGIFMLRQFFKSFPQEVIEAARLDGFSELAIAWRIVLPSAWPAVSAFAVFSAIAHWNDLYWPLIVITQPDLATPPLGIVFFRNQESGDDFGALMAGATVVSVPLIIAFLFAQRSFVRGVTATGIK
jgi:multiple sugar transport system permease protein